MSKPKHENSVEFKVYGDYALFSDILTRPGGEKSTYPVPTYEAIKGVLHSLYWKPTIVWYVDKLRVMKKIRTERKGVRPISYGGGNDLSYYTYLADVEYQVKAHFEWNDNRPELACDRDENKHFHIALRSLSRGGRRSVFLGTSDCTGYVRPARFGSGRGFYDGCDKDFGVMYHGITYPDENLAEPQCMDVFQRSFRCVMTDGIIKFPPPEECQSEFLRHGAVKWFGDIPLTV